MSEYNRQLLRDAMIGNQLGELRLELLDRLGRSMADNLVDMGIARSCLNCDSWRKNKNTGQHYGCELAKAMPPLEVIVVGCEKHSDLIPF